MYAHEISWRMTKWFTVQPCSKLRKEKRKSEKSSGVPTTSDVQSFLVLIYFTLGSQFFDFVTSISPVFFISAGILILLAIVLEIWRQSDFEPSAPRRIGRMMHGRLIFFSPKFTELNRTAEKYFGATNRRFKRFGI